VLRRTAIALIVAAVAVAAAGTLTPPASATSLPIAQLRQQHTHVRHLLEAARLRARHAASDLAAAQALAGRAGGAGSAPDAGITPAAGLTSADQDLLTRLLADGVVSDDELAALQARVAATRLQVQRWTVKLGRLTRRIRGREQIAAWAQAHRWRPLVRIAGHRYGVDPGGLYRMMMLESGGNQRVVGGIYNGLFQYTHSEWARHWNPWRHQSICDGWAQIRATALALSKGMGPGQWPYTYPMAF
jgi:soluble lytic murein transglycosylase-like protein